jgi:hypothetical protein
MTHRPDHIRDNIPDNSPIAVRHNTAPPAQAMEIAQCERGDLNPTCDRENPAFSRIATVKDRRRPSRIVPDRHNLAGGDETKPEGAWASCAHLPDKRISAGPPHLKVGDFDGGRRR